MGHRFFCEHLSESGTVKLVETEAHHLMHVLRHQIDDVVELFRGDGLVASCRIQAIRKRDVDLEVQQSRFDEPSIRSLTLATAVPKGDRFEWLVEKATELGVDRLIPLTTGRSSVDPRGSKLDKLRQTVITACKQSGRNHLMAISDVTCWDQFLRQRSPECLLMVAHPQGLTVDQVLAESNSPIQSFMIAIGPEGGFLDEEISQAIESQAKTIHLGRNLLRIETAAIGLAARILL